MKAISSRIGSASPIPQDTPALMVKRSDQNRVVIMKVTTTTGTVTKIYATHNTVTGLTLAPSPFQPKDKPMRKVVIKPTMSKPSIQSHSMRIRPTLPEFM